MILRHIVEFSYFSAFLIKISLSRYYSGIRASILDQLAGFQFSVVAIMVRDYFQENLCWPFYTSFIMKAIDGFEK